MYCGMTFIVFSERRDTMRNCLTQQNSFEKKFKYFIIFSIISIPFFLDSNSYGPVVVENIRDVIVEGGDFV